MDIHVAHLIYFKKYSCPAPHSPRNSNRRPNHKIKRKKMRDLCQYQKQCGLKLDKHTVSYVVGLMNTCRLVEHNLMGFNMNTNHSLNRTQGLLLGS